MRKNILLPLIVLALLTFSCNDTVQNASNDEVSGDAETIVVDEQDNNDEDEWGNKTKMDYYSSRTGIIMKFVDVNLPDLSIKFGRAKTRIRTLKYGGDDVCFYQIEKEGGYGTSVASIEYSDLLDVIKAMEVLESEVSVDLQSNPDYLENKYTTIDGFQIGYYVSGGKATWYIRLERFGSGNTLFLNDGGEILQSMETAKSKIEELKQL